jgi:hypothetical protein
MAVLPGTAERRELEPTAPPTPPRWTAGRIALLVTGSLLALLALAVIVTGAYGIWLHTTQRSGGYVMTSSERFTTGGYALATRTLHISSDVPSFLYGRDWLGDVRVRGESADPARPLFIGIAAKADVDRYLAGVAHSDVTDVNANPFGTTYRPSYRARPGGKPAIAPTRLGRQVRELGRRGHAPRRLARRLRRPRRGGEAARAALGIDRAPGVRPAGRGRRGGDDLLRRARAALSAMSALSDDAAATHEPHGDL